MHSEQHPEMSGLLPNIYWGAVEMDRLRASPYLLALPPVQGLTLADHSSYSCAAQVLSARLPWLAY